MPLPPHRPRARARDQQPLDPEALPGLLIVDDTADLRDLVRLQLAARPDLRVLGEAHDGAHGIAQCEDLRPEVVILDVQMPVMNGLDALPHIKLACPHSQVIMHSSLTDQSVMSRARELGACDYIVKGTGRAALLAAVDRALATTCA